MTIDRLIEDLQQVKSRIGGECEVRVTNAGPNCTADDMLMYIESVCLSDDCAGEKIVEIFVTEITRA